ncbi:MAG: hypothetical protein AB2L20_07435 [Mangrovibacterium sp.]
METTHTTVIREKNSEEMDLLINTPFFQTLKIGKHEETIPDLLNSSFKEFVYRLHTVFGTETNQLPYLYRLTNYTIAQLNLMKAEIIHIESGEKHSN